MNFRYQCIHLYNFEDVERILSCTCTVLCYILEYIYMMQIAKIRTSHVFAFNMQIPYQVECLVMCVSLLFERYRYIQKYKYKNIFNIHKTVHLYETKYAQLHNSRIYVNVYIGIGRTCMYNGLLNNSAYNKIRKAQSAEHRTTNLRAVGSNITVGKNFSFCILSLSRRTWQVDWSVTNEIKHDVYPRCMDA